MAQMAAQQAAFTLAARFEDDSDASDDDVNDSRGDAPADRLVDRMETANHPPERASPTTLPWEDALECGLCRGGAKRDDPLVWVGLAQRSATPGACRRRAPSRRRPAPRPKRAPLASPSRPGDELGAFAPPPIAYDEASDESDDDASSDPVPLFATRTSSYVDTSDDDASSNPNPEDPDHRRVDAMDIDAANGESREDASAANRANRAKTRRRRVFASDGEGVQVMSCGHAVHASCHDRFVAAAVGVGVAGGGALGAEQLAMRAQSGLHGDDFHCPTCRRLCNVAVPVLPPLPSQLAEARLASESESESTATATTTSEELREGALRMLTEAGATLKAHMETMVRWQARAVAAAEAAAGSNEAAAAAAAAAAASITDGEYVEKKCLARPADASPSPSPAPEALHAAFWRRARDGDGDGGDVIGGDAAATATATATRPERMRSVARAFAARVDTVATCGPSSSASASAPEEPSMSLEHARESHARARAIAPWALLKHNVAQLEVLGRPARGVGNAEEDDEAVVSGTLDVPQPPPAVPAAAKAAVEGQWRAMREIARLACVGAPPPPGGGDPGAARPAAAAKRADALVTLTEIVRCVLYTGPHTTPSAW